MTPVQLQASASTLVLRGVRALFSDSQRYRRRRRRRRCSLGDGLFVRGLRRRHGAVGCRRGCRRVPVSPFGCEAGLQSFRAACPRKRGGREKPCMRKLPNSRRLRLAGTSPGGASARAVVPLSQQRRASCGCAAEGLLAARGSDLGSLLLALLASLAPFPRPAGRPRRPRPRWTRPSSARRSSPAPEPASPFATSCSPPLSSTLA